VAVGLAFTTMMTSGGIALGPLITGFLQESLGDLRLALLIVSFSGLSLTAAGVLLRRTSTDQLVPAGDVAG
jgi:MFS family permease